MTQTPATNSGPANPHLRIDLDAAMAVADDCWKVFHKANRRRGSAYWRYAKTGNAPKDFQELVNDCEEAFDNWVKASRKVERIRGMYMVGREFQPYEPPKRDYGKQPSAVTALFGTPEGD